MSLNLRVCKAQMSCLFPARVTSVRLFASQSEDMHLQWTVLIVWLISGTLAGTIESSNDYVDTLLEMWVPTFARASGMERVPLDSFSFVILKNWRPKRNITAEFSRGVLGGLDTPTGLSRAGDCTAPTLQFGNITVACYVSLDGLEVRYHGYIKGEIITPNTIGAEASLHGAKAYMEVTSALGEPPALKAWSILPFYVTVKFSRKLNLRTTPDEQFEAAVERNINTAVVRAFYGPVQRLISSTVREEKLPLPKLMTEPIARKV
ncbi:uncharacterized protein LOC135385579 isoform X2 [Ornithodoros turicata]|uniref:uncharacterized protein LOC135385579 isoform X2 n=1 Tax=Ornithodoros turicata TaxID=34597 RepID=UPI003138F530